MGTKDIKEISGSKSPGSKGKLKTSKKTPAQKKKSISEKISPIKSDEEFDFGNDFLNELSRAESRPDENIGKLIKTETSALTTDREKELDPEALARGDIPMSIVDHLDELRSRIIIILLSFFIFAGTAFYFSDLILYFINRPFRETGNMLNIFTMAGGFMVKMKVSVILALIVIIPHILFHIWRFISPAIDRPDRFFSRLTILFSFLFFYFGITFVFFILPFLVKILLSFIDNTMQTTIGADDYLYFLFFTSFVMGFIFELPIVVLVLTKIGFLTPAFLISKRKYAVIIIWIVSAIITPGADILSQCLIAVPLMLLYEISIFISKFALKRKKLKELKQMNYI